METAIKKWGNSAAIRIPSKIFEDAKLNFDQVLNIAVEDGHVVLKPVYNHRYVLDDLLSGITAENQHHPVEVNSGRGCN